MIAKVTAMASRGLRCICASQAELPVSDPSRESDFLEDSDNVDRNLTAVAIFGIKVGGLCMCAYAERSSSRRRSM